MAMRLSFCVHTLVNGCLARTRVGCSETKCNGSLTQQHVAGVSGYYLEAEYVCMRRATLTGGGGSLARATRRCGAELRARLRSRPRTPTQEALCVGLRAPRPRTGGRSCASRMHATWLCCASMVHGGGSGVDGVDVDCDSWPWPVSTAATARQPAPRPPLQMPLRWASFLKGGVNARA